MHACIEAGEEKRHLEIVAVENHEGFAVDVLPCHDFRIHSRAFAKVLRQPAHVMSNVHR
jgi:hypothetical protein